MRTPITITELEAAINAFKRHHPSGSLAYAGAMPVLASLYGALIYQRADHFDLDQQPPLCQAILKQWLRLESEQL